MNIKLQQLRYFVSVADHGSISAASASLGIAQPAVSRRLADLEQEVGATLLQRRSTGVFLTETGKVFLDHARAVLRRLDRAERDLMLARGAVPDEVRFVVPPALSRFVAAPLVRAVMTEYPNIRVTCIETHWDDARKRMEEGRGDLALVTNGHLFANTNAEAWLRDLIYFGGALTSEFHGDAPIGMAEIARQPLIMPSRRYLIRRMLDEIAAHQGLSLAIAHEIDSGTLTESYLEEGLGFTISIWQTFFAGVARGQMFARPIALPALDRTLTIVTQRPEHRTHATEIAAGFLRERLTSLYRAGILRGTLLQGGPA
ncbi:transcriptional regulator, LysR family [Gemmobacter megaterium]|uniref:Transcriptional regulator, LysR family n=1 Tax=Gemmobacter megaterium TaxID=1086013 RepID=A0A1N7QQA8_9RHOB|nr:LysR family transcriptional regulator [Gemmobacter megaterium]GGE28685.1 transcriptional regulator [Gemmobacter megaterium]SIT25095.1 transcriptional regulator, LysR family [Gemmobacter megaterium]